MKCPACQAELDHQTKFCAKCGQKIPRCPTCGEPITTRMKFCSKDGTPIPQELLDLLPGGPAVAAAPVKETKTEVPVQKEAPKVFGTCLSCGSTCPEGRKLCSTCAARIRRERELAAQKQLTKFCAKCGRPIAEGMKLCDDCASVSEPVPEESSKKIWILVAVAAVAAVLAVGACVWLLMGGNGNSGGKDQKSEKVESVDSNWFAEDYENEDIYYDEDLDSYVVAPKKESAVETTAPIVMETEPATEPPTEAPTEPEVNEDARVLYFLNNCDRLYLSYNDVEGFDEEMCRIARNGIYAKSGRKFKDASLQAYFEQYDWYYPTVDPSAFTAGMLNEYQNANLNMIMSYEREHGYR